MHHHLLASAHAGIGEGVRGGGLFVVVSSHQGLPNYSLERNDNETMRGGGGVQLSLFRATIISINLYH